MSCPTLPVTLRLNAKCTLPTYYKVKAPTPIYSLFPHRRYEPVAYGPSFRNELEAIKSRVLKQTPIVDPIVMRDFVLWTQRNYHKLFPGFRKRNPWSMEDYLKNSNASPAVKRTILTAHNQLNSLGQKDTTVLSPNELYKYTLRKAFVKVECNLYKTPQGVAEKAPRLIQGATPEFISLVGPTFSAIQKEICRVWGRKFSCFFTSGATTTSVSKYLLEPEGLKWFENDVGAFDASVGYDLGLLEVWLAEKMGARRAVLDLMRANLFTHGYTSFGIHYKVRGTRKSGDPYTSCFNSVLNGLMHLYCLSRNHSLDYVLPRVRMVVQGDDNLMRYHPSLNPDWSLLLRLGFKCDNLNRSGPEDAEFCSSRFYPTGGSYTLGPKIGRVLNKIGWFINPPLFVHPMSVIRGVALGFNVLGDLIPLLGIFLRRILEKTSNHKSYIIKDGDWKMSLRGGVSDESKYEYNMWYWYGLNTSMLDACGSKLATADFGKDHTDIYFDLMFDEETLGPKLIF